jgi:DNA invertase Pin-like site-specific DNA recombinase
VATVLYARVSTKDQTIEHQRTQAEAAGFKIDREFADHGVSGVSIPLAERPEGKRLFDALRSGDTLVVRWVDRLGRDYNDVSDAIREFMRRGVIIRTIINNMTFDGATTDPIQMAVRDALIGFMAATAQSQAEAMKEARRAGIAHAKRPDAEERKYLGRKPSFSRKQFDTVCNMLHMASGVSEIAAATALSRQTIYRIRDDRTGAEAALVSWAEKGRAA